MKITPDQAKLITKSGIGECIYCPNKLQCNLKKDSWSTNTDECNKVYQLAAKSYINYLEDSCYTKTSTIQKANAAIYELKSNNIKLASILKEALNKIP